MALTIIEKRQISLGELHALEQLIHSNLHHQGYANKLHWNILHKRQGYQANDYLCWQDEQLVGFLAAFEFSWESKEISLVADKTQNSALIKRQLLTTFMVNEQYHGTKSFDVICPRDDQASQQSFKQLQATHLSSYAEMQSKITDNQATSHLPKIHLALASSEHLPCLAELGTACFHSKLQDNLCRFADNMNDSHRKIWLVYYQATLIGKIHIRYDYGNKIYLHDLCILPAFRGKKLATAMITQVMQLLAKDNYHQFYLDVDYCNASALRLYHNCHFSINGIYDLWRLTPSQLTHYTQQLNR